MRWHCFVLFAMQDSLQRKFRKSFSKLVYLPLDYMEVGLNGCRAWKKSGKAAMAHLPRGIWGHHNGINLQLWRKQRIPGVNPIKICRNL
jgi:hypothetical protein